MAGRALPDIRGGDGEPLIVEVEFQAVFHRIDGTARFIAIESSAECHHDHDGYPNCKPRTGLLLHEQVQNEMYGGDAAEEDE